MFELHGFCLERPDVPTVRCLVGLAEPEEVPWLILLFSVWPSQNQHGKSYKEDLVSSLEWFGLGLQQVCSHIPFPICVTCLAALGVTEQRVMGWELEPEIFLLFGSRGF